MECGFDGVGESSLGRGMFERSRVGWGSFGLSGVAVLRVVGCLGL